MFNVKTVTQSKNNNNKNKMTIVPRASLSLLQHISKEASINNITWYGDIYWSDLSVHPRVKLKMNFHFSTISDVLHGQNTLKIIRIKYKAFKSTTLR